MFILYLKKLLAKFKLGCFFAKISHPVRGKNNTPGVLAQPEKAE